MAWSNPNTHVYHMMDTKSVGSTGAWNSEVWYFHSLLQQFP